MRWLGFVFIAIVAAAISPPFPSAEPVRLVCDGEMRALSANGNAKFAKNREPFFNNIDPTRTSNCPTARAPDQYSLMSTSDYIRWMGSKWASSTSIVASLYRLAVIPFLHRSRPHGGYVSCCCESQTFVGRDVTSAAG
jgi:hypothetical protein